MMNPGGMRKQKTMGGVDMYGRPGMMIHEEWEGQYAEGSEKCKTR